MEDATLTFPSRQAGQQFATAWAFKSLTGYAIGVEDEKGRCEVKIYNLTPKLKEWVERYIKENNAD